MNENDGNNYKDLHGACESDKQIYTELNYLQPDDRNEHVYYELHRPDERRRSSQQQAPSIVNKRLQPVSKIAIFQVVSQILILLLLLMGIIVSLILITMTTTAVLDPESVQHLLSQQISHLQNNITKNTTQGLTNIADALNTSIIQSNNIQQQIGTVSILQAIQNMTESIAHILHIVDEHLVYSQTNTNALDQLSNFNDTLNFLKDTSTTVSEVIGSVFVAVEKLLLLEIQNVSILSSCKDIKTVLPNSPTGYYHVNSRNIYCNMGELCGTGGGWTRLAYLDMSDSTVNCPTGFRLYQSGGVRACGRPDSSGGNCSSVQYPSNGISYSQICGRVVGYQYGSPDAVYSYINNINSYYVDGVSITRGSPRQHVWTLMAGVKDSSTDAGNCPCNTPPGGTQQIRPFIGSNYFCESGNPNNTWTITLYTEDPLWDGKGCGTQETVCCSAPGLPWFHRDYGNVTTTDYIELRVCADQLTSDEDVPVSFYEVYVK